MTVSQDIRGALDGFDGRATTLLGEAEARFSGEPEYLSTVIGLVDDADPMVQSGATWLLKSALEQNRSLTAKQTAHLIDRLDAIADWSAQLHICQCAHHFALDDRGAVRFAEWLQPLLMHERPFLRAWSMNALCELGRKHASVRAAALDALAGASEDNSASVRARARNIAPL